MILAFSYPSDIISTQQQRKAISEHKHVGITVAAKKIKCIADQ